MAQKVNGRLESPWPSKEKDGNCFEEKQGNGRTGMQAKARLQTDFTN
jgi:hypothetical protein